MVQEYTKTGYTSYSNYRNQVENLYDFLPKDQDGFHENTSGGSVVEGSSDGLIGAVLMTVNSGAIGNRAAFLRSQTNTVEEIKLSAGIYTLEQIIKTGSALPDATDDYEYIIGCGELVNTLANLDWGCYFRLRNDAGTAKLLCVTEKTTGGAGTTETDTGLTLAANTKYRCKLIVNAAGTEVRFFVNGVLEATHTTNIETTEKHDIISILSAINSMATNRDIYIDSFYEKFELTATR